MPHYSKVLSIKQGFNFDKDKQDKVGFLTKLTIGKQKFEADFMTIMDPLAPTDKLKGGAVAVLNSFDWNTGATDAIYISGQISTQHRQMIAEMLLGTWSDVTVEFGFCIYEYEPGQRKFFQSAFVDKALHGLLEKNGSDLNLDVADDPSMEVQSPQNYSFRIGIKPKSEEQQIQLAVGEKRKITKKWGITESKA
jgi:hypothetical protein